MTCFPTRGEEVGLETAEVIAQCDVKWIAQTPPTGLRPQTLNCGENRLKTVHAGGGIIDDVLIQELAFLEESGLDLLEEIKQVLLGHEVHCNLELVFRHVE